MKNLTYSLSILLGLMSLTNPSFAAKCYEPGIIPGDEDELVENSEDGIESQPQFSEPAAALGCPIRDPEPPTKKNPPPATQCAILFADASWGGVSFAIAAGNKVTDFSAHLYERRKWRGTLQGWSGSDKSYNDIFSSVVVQPKCVLQVWEASDFNGESRYHGGTENEARSISLISVGFDNITSSASCTCATSGLDLGGGPVLPPPAHIRSSYFEIPPQ